MKTIKFLWQKFKCDVLKRHELGDSTRLPGETPWHEFEFIAPVTGDKILCYRREFKAEQFCVHCAARIVATGYDQKPHETDPFFLVKKTKENSRGLHLTQEQYEQHVKKLPRSNP